MNYRLLPIVLLATFGLAVAAETGTATRAPNAQPEIDFPLDAPAPDGRRPGGTITHEFTPPKLQDDENKDVRRERNYPEQPPTIPHSIRGYHVDINGNKCLACHSRANSSKAQAPMISITHYTDRDGQTLAAVAPRRYFCTQCHVPQQDVKPLVENNFQNIDVLLQHELPQDRQ
ncbi:nitrate reductase cytochrome c-type subunit [Pseudomonas mangrovi]|jgi:cytochrome c-type protein NapB|uniref:Periplasmic nitrate reductase, electron transfer subunit n=1 Tax=Pseudomonas mangrovi TaxID=2161748 RepID=A0A2T5PD74_9PSED|nr:nitrate reductase cytochrome c-type subunit [Pseudomonas mangrovi]PTU75667.1 cytochrome C [Pseudomonas mangrovi]